MSKIDITITELNNLTDAIVENIINTPDKDILKEVKEEYGDPNYKANIMQNILLKARVEVGKKKMDLVKRELEEYNNEKSNITKEESSETLDEQDLEKLTMAARDGTGITEKDKPGVLEDFEELKKMKYWKNKEKS